MKYLFAPKELLTCPICSLHMGSTQLVTYFSARCINNHFVEGVIKDNRIITVVTTRKRLGNRKAKIKYYPPPLDNYQLALVVQKKNNPLADHYLCCIEMQPEDYKRYENDPIALRKRLEIAETFK